MHYKQDDCRIALADLFAGARLLEDTHVKLSSPQFRRCPFNMMPEGHFTITVKEVLDGKLSAGDFYWKDSLRCPLTGDLPLPADEDIGDYLKEREKSAAGHRA